MLLHSAPASAGSIRREGRGRCLLMMRTEYLSLQHYLLSQLQRPDWWVVAVSTPPVLPLPHIFSCGSDGKESTCSSGDLSLTLGSGRSPGEVFLPGEFHGQRSLAGYSPWGLKETQLTRSLYFRISPLSSTPHRPPACRNVGVSRPGPGFAESALHHDEDRGREGGPEAKVEVAADTAEQGGGYLSAWQGRDRAGRSQGQDGVLFGAPASSLSYEMRQQWLHPLLKPTKEEPIPTVSPCPQRPDIHSPHLSWYNYEDHLPSRTRLSQPER